MRLCVVSEEISVKLNKLCPSKFQSKGLQDTESLFILPMRECSIIIHSFIHSFTSLNLIFNWQNILVYISQILKLNSPSQINNYHQYLLMEIHGQCQLFLYQLKGLLGNADACFPLFQTVRGISGVFPTSVRS